MNTFAVAPDEGFVHPRPRMTPFWIDTTAAGRIATAARPHGGSKLEGDVAGLREMGVDVLVSLLEPREVMKLRLEAERDLAEHAGMEFLSFPIPDHGLPQSPVAVSRLVSALARAVKEGRSVVAHCRAGIGRSSLIAALTLMQAERRVTPEAALERISEARGLNVPDTDAQRKWLLAFRARL